MFTGLIEEMGIVTGVQPLDKGILLTIQADQILQDAKIGDSIMTDGVCLTAISVKKNEYSAEVMNETLKRSTLGNLKVGHRINLEKSLTLQTPLGGHLVTGDVDCQGTIQEIVNDGIAKIFTIKPEAKNYLRYLVYKGRVTIDGASLTVMELKKESFSVSLIPHTLENIGLGKKKVGESVNLEFDLIAKHIERLLLFDKKEESQELDVDFLRENGFIVC